MLGAGTKSGMGEMSSQSSSSLALPPAGSPVSRSSSDRGRNRSSPMAATSTIETEHPSELQRGLALPAVFNERDQRDRIAAPVVRSEVGPDAALQVDLETSRVAIAAPRIERDILATRPSAVGEQAATDGLERGERLGVDAVEVDGAVTKHWS